MSLEEPNSVLQQEPPWPSWLIYSINLLVMQSSKTDMEKVTLLPSQLILSGQLS